MHCKIKNACTKYVCPKLRGDNHDTKKSFDDLYEPCSAPTLYNSYLTIEIYCLSYVVLVFDEKDRQEIKYNSY